MQKVLKKFLSFFLTVAVMVSLIPGLAQAAPPVITLNGETVMNIPLYTFYIDPGAKAFDFDDGDISHNIVIGGDFVDFFTPGTYYVSYDVVNSNFEPAEQVIRTVNVIGEDTILPIITLIGPAKINLVLLTPYDEPGAQAQDNMDGDISDQVVINGEVDISMVGTYYITYNVSDSSGNAAQEVVRTINVVEPDDVPPVITLIGPAAMNVILFTPYDEPGAQAYDSTDGDISDQIVIGGDFVDFFILGTYYVTYNVSDSSGNAAQEMVRTINVVEPDDVPPVITLIGPAEMNVILLTPYDEPGAQAQDNVDGDISDNIVISGEVDIFMVGTYYITYNVSDSAGNAAQEVVRTVNVFLPVFSIDTVGHSNITTNSAVISWTTSAISSSYLEYGTSQAYGQVLTTAAISISHSLSLSGLTAGTTYYYRLLAEDEYGQTANAGPLSFTTSAPVSSGGGGGGDSSPTPTDPSPTPSAYYQYPVKKQKAVRNNDEVVITWENPRDQNYAQTVIIRSQTQIFNYMDFATMSDYGEIIYSGNGNSFTDTSAAANLDYYYAIFTRNKDGLYSQPVILLSTAPKPAPVSDPDKKKKTVKSADYTYGDYSHLGEVSGEIVDMVSLDEASRVYDHNQNVDLNDNTRRLYLFITAKSPHNLNEQDRFALAFFIHEGTPTTNILGAGERTGVVNSYLSAFNKLPRNESEWQDVIKIANGRWPQKRNDPAESLARSDRFVNIYKRQPDMKNPHDNAAVTVIAYGLRPAIRNLDSEKAGIRIFRAIFRSDPISAVDWDIVRAIAYSGAVR